MRNIITYLKYFWPSIKPYKWYYLIMFSATVFSSFQMLLSYYGIKLIIDILTTSPNFTYQELIFPVSIFIGAQLFHEFIWGVSNIAQWRSEPHVKKDITLRTYDYIQNHSYKFFQDNFVGSLTSKVKDIEKGYKAIREAIHFGFTNRLISIIVATISISFIQPYIGLFIVLWTMLICILTYFCAKKLLHMTASMMKAKYKVIGYIADRFSNILSMMLFSSRNREKTKLYQSIDKTIIPQEIKRGKYEMITSRLQGLLYVIMTLIIISMLIYYRKSGTISIGDFAFVISISLYLTEQIWRMMLDFQEFSWSMGELHSAMNVINTQHDLKDSRHAKKINLSNKPIPIEFKNLYFSYATRDIFQGFNLKIHPGEKIAIVGYSGGGKSTLISLLLKYFHLDKGEILINNTHINNITSDSLRDHISVIPQDIVLFHDTLIENIRYSKPTATDEEIVDAAKKAYIHDHIMTLPDKYKTFVGERGVKISVGQRQRIAIARAILKDAPILVLDEATSSLDSKTENFIQESIDNILSHNHKTIIAIAHRLSTIKHMDRIIVIADGKIAEEGKHSSLLKKKGIYADLWQHQKI